MNDAPRPGENALTHGFPAEAEQQRRLAKEADSLNANGADWRRQQTLRALADVDAGRLIDDAAMKAWADSLGSERELPIPQPG